MLEKLTLDQQTIMAKQSLHDFAKTWKKRFPNISTRDVFDQLMNITRDVTNNLSNDPKGQFFMNWLKNYMKVELGL